MTPPRQRGGDTGGNVPLPGMPGTEPDQPQDGTAGTTGRPALPTHSSSGSTLPQMEPTERSSPAFRERIFGFVTGRRGGGALEGDRRAQLIAAFGANPRDPSRPNIAAAARGMGVSPRSVQRWAAGAGISRRHQQALTTRARQAMTTRRGRAAALRASGDLTLPRGKNALRVGGDQGVVSASDGNYRVRETRAQVSPEDLQRMQDLWVEHGEAGVAAFLHDHFDQHYYSGWHFRSIDDIGWDNSSSY